jgi:hypothetical protein
MKKKTHPVPPPKGKADLYVGRIRMSEVRETARKPLPPPTKRHQVKTTYRRKPKHPGKGLE